MPPKPHHKKPPGHKPIHKKPHPRHRPPEQKRKGDSGRLWASVIVGFGLTAFVAAVMAAFAIPVSVILPTCAPILVGAVTLAYTIQKD